MSTLLVEITQEVLAEVVGADPGEILRFRPVGVALAGQNHEIEVLIGFDECVRQPQRVAGMHVVVDGNRHVED